MGVGNSKQKKKLSIEKVANKHKIKSLASVAIGCVVTKAPTAFFIVGIYKQEHLQDNIWALRLKLKASQVEHLESQNASDVGFPGNFIGPDLKVTGKSSFLLAVNGAHSSPGSTPSRVRNRFNMLKDKF